MGEPVTVIQKSSSRPGFVRFETNRSFTGMGHEAFSNIGQIKNDRPLDNLAKMLFEEGKVEQVHMYGQVLTVKVSDESDTSKLQKLIEDFYIFYKPGVPIPDGSDF